MCIPTHFVYGHLCIDPHGSDESNFYEFLHIPEGYQVHSFILWVNKGFYTIKIPVIEKNKINLNPNNAVELHCDKENNKKIKGFDEGEYCKVF